MILKSLSQHSRTADLRVVFAAASILAASSAPAAAATYYVAPGGSDSNSCAAAQNPGAAKLTIAAGVACLSAGDTLYLRQGTYIGSSNLVDSESFPIRSGTSWSAPITIAGHPGETAVIRPPNGRQAIRLTSGAPHHLIFQDLVLDGSNQTILPTAGGPDLVYLSTGAHHNRFQRLEVKNNSSNGFALSDNGGSADYNEILDCSIHDNGRLDEGNTGYGIYLKTNNNLIAGNDIYRNNGYGIHQYAPAGNGNNNVIRGNRIHDNAVHGTIGVGGGSSYAVVLINGDSNLIANNLIYKNQGGILVYNNTTNAQIYNNTITGNSGNAIDLQYYGSSPVIKNNILYSNGGSIANHGGNGSPIMDRNLTSDPGFANVSALDFRLSVQSAAKDRGVALSLVLFDYAGVARPQAGGYDIGAYEYIDAPAAPTTGPPPPQNVRIVNY